MIVLGKQKKNQQRIQLFSILKSLIGKKNRQNMLEQSADFDVGLSLKLFN